jgi:hypothetical protein
LLVVYTSTYISSNLSDHIHVNGVDPAILKLMITFVVNTTASLAKDKALLKDSAQNKKNLSPWLHLDYFFLEILLQ